MVLNKLIAVAIAGVLLGAAPQVAVRYAVAPGGNEARYRVREQLAGVDLPNDAIGATSAVSGQLAFDKKGNLISDSSKIIVNLTGLKSDKDRRDGFVQRRLMETATYPNAELVPTAIKGLKYPFPKTGTQKVEVTGNLTVKGVTKPTTWTGQVTFNGANVTGSITTAFTFDDFQMTKPKVPVVLSVEDTIKLEYDLSFIKQ